MKLRSALLGLLLLALTPSAASAITIGSNAVGSPSPGFFTCGSPPCVLIQDTIGGSPVRVPNGNWILTGWRVRGAEGAIELVVVQPTGGTSSSLEGTLGASSGEQQGAGGDQLQEFGARLAVTGGQMIGLALDTGSTIGGLTAGGDTVIFETPIQSPFNTSAFGNVEQLVQATVEPDTDGDGYGDASQDGCPTNPQTQGACPAAPGPPDPLADLRAGKRPAVRLASKKVSAPKGTVRVEIVNPNGYQVKGSLTLRRKGRKAGSRKYEVAGNGSTTVRVKLSRAARRALKRAGKLKLAASATVRGPVGRAGSLKATLTVTKRAPRQPRTGSGGFVGRTKNINVEFSFDLVGNEMRNIKGGINVTCFYPGGTSRSGVEVYDPPAPFALGPKAEQFADDKPSAILGSNVRKRYTMEASRSGNVVAGTIQVSYGFSAYNPSTGFFDFGSCVGEDTFTARRR